ncbi:MAG: ABC transporter permease, partial [Lachnospiraceae bacterium]|nr:ABC transporter permease [Lachnospiraceae bacterium]
MRRYIFKRILLLIPVMLGISFVIFMIISIAPGNAVEVILPSDATEAEIEALTTSLGLDQPLLVQYGQYLLGMLHGDLGTSWYTGESVMSSFLERLPATMALVVASLVIGTVVAIPLGVLSALHPRTMLDKALSAISFAGVSIPTFWLGLMLILLFSVRLGLLPSGGSGGLEYIIMPALVWGVGHAAELMRMTRASMLDVVNSDFVRMARSKGIKESSVIYGHALKNAIIPVLTILGNLFSNGIGGSTVLETVFSYPGIG